MSFHIRLIKNLFLASTISLSTAAFANEQSLEKLQQSIEVLIQKNARQERRIEQLEKSFKCVQQALLNRQDLPNVYAINFFINSRLRPCLA